MPIYTRGSSFIVSVGSGESRFRETFGTKLEAEEAEAQETLRRRFKRNKSVTPSGPVEDTKKPTGRTLKRLLRFAISGQWAAAKAQGHMIRNATFCLDHLGHDREVSDITRTDLRELVEHLSENGNSGSTVNRKLSALSVLMNIAVDEGWLDNIPKFPRMREGSHRIRYFTGEEEQVMLKQCDHRGFTTLADFIALGIDTGFRKTELLGLTLRDCGGGVATLHADSTKSGKDRKVPLTDRCKEIVVRRKALEYSKLFEDMTYSQLRWQWDILRESLGKKDDDGFIVHALRHTCASRLAIGGENAVFIMEWMGHSSIMVTQRYMHLGDSLKQGTATLDKYREAV